MSNNESAKFIEKCKEVSDYKYALDESSIIVVTDQKGIISHVNDSFCEISKYSREELLDQDLNTITLRNHPKEFVQNIWTTIECGNIWKGELKNSAKDGSFYWVDTVIVPFLDDNKKPYKYIVILSDVFKRKKSEEKISQMIIHTESQNKQLIDFCNIVSHNLRAPLVNISMLVDYMQSCEDDSERDEVISKIQPTINHLNDILDELVGSLHISQSTDVESTTIDLKKTLDNILIGFEAQIKQCNATIEIDFSEVKTITYPQNYIDSILTNLICNALKYKSPDRNIIINIKTHYLNDKIILSIADNGLGFDIKLHKDNVFKIRKTFHNHPNSRGLGLFMIKTQVEAMGGEIWAESTPNKGSTFYIQIKP